MKIIYKASELEKVKKIKIALGLDHKNVDDTAKKLGKTLKKESALKKELSDEAKKPSKE